MKKYIVILILAVINLFAMANWADADAANHHSNVIATSIVMSIGAILIVTVMLMFNYLESFDRR